MINKDKELSNCSFVKTILMMLVVLYHCILYWNGSWFVGEPVYVAKPLAFIASWLNSFHIYGFTLVSGYIFYALKYEKDKYAKYLPFLLNKTKRLLVPYVFTSIVWAIPFAVYFQKYDFTKIANNFLLGTAPSQLWFLLMLFCVFAIFFPFSNLFREKQVLGAILVLLFYGGGYVVGQKIPNVFQIFRALTYLPLFYIGFKIRQFGSEKIRKIPWWVWILAHVLLFVFSKYISGLNGIMIKLISLGTNFILHIVGALMAFSVLQKLAEKIKWKENGVLKLFTKFSMPIYLFHQQIVYIFIVLLNGVINPYLHAGINFVGAIIVSFVISFVLMKFKWMRILMGEK